MKLVRHIPQGKRCLPISSTSLLIKVVKLEIYESIKNCPATRRASITRERVATTDVTLLLIRRYKFYPHNRN